MTNVHPEQDYARFLNEDHFMILRCMEMRGLSSQATLILGSELTL